MISHSQVNDNVDAGKDLISLHRQKSCDSGKSTFTKLYMSIINHRYREK